MANVLSVSGLTVKVEDDTVLDSISFSLEKGEGLAVVGPNGAGKTMLIRALLGMVPYQGEVRWAQKVKIGYVPQKIDADRHLPMNVRNLLTAKAKIFGLSKNDVEEVVKTVGLTAPVLMTPIGHLSGGEFQRAILAFALLGKPGVLILDEPTASIDAHGEEQVYELIHRLQDTYGITIILVSHDLQFVYRYATKVLCINRVNLCFGTPDEALTPEVMEKLYGPHKYFHRFHDELHGEHDHNHA